jgi:lipoprotein-releasing system permease protein
VVNVVELRIDDIYAAPEVASGATTAAGKGLDATTWMDQNAQLLSALKMERVVTVITIGLIQMVAALNILISLIMMVMEKHRDIAILMSMGARKEQISRLFQLQGVLIGVAGIILGLAAGYTLCYFADRGRWVQLDASVYALSFVPFEPRWLDGAWISAAALLVSFLATVYPARSAARIAPAEALRYE